MGRDRLSIGFVSPLPPVRSGIADYSAELLPELGALATVVAYAPEAAAKAFAAGHDVVLLQVGNDPKHLGSVEALAAARRSHGSTPAVLVLHEYSLHHLYAAGYLDTGRGDDYARELERSHGARGRELAERFLAGSVVPVWETDPWGWPMCGGPVEDADAVIVHSRLLRGAVLRLRPGTRVVEIPIHVAPVSRTPKDVARRRLDLPQDRPVVATLGFVTPAKRISQILEALAVLEPHERPFLLVGGEVVGGDPLRAKIEELHLAADVRITGYLPEETFWEAASAADLAVNLRYPTVGESSGVVCRLAGLGLPFVVSDIGWFRELPESFSRRVPVGAGEIDALAALLRETWSSPETLAARGAAAAEWGRMHRPRKSAERYLEILREAADGLSRPRGLTGRLSLELAGVGVCVPGAAASRSPDAAVVSNVAAAMTGLFPALVPPT